MGTKRRSMFNPKFKNVRPDRWKLGRKLLGIPTDEEIEAQRLAEQKATEAVELAEQARIKAEEEAKVKLKLEQEAKLKAEEEVKVKLSRTTTKTTKTKATKTKTTKNRRTRAKKTADKE